RYVLFALLGAALLAGAAVDAAVRVAGRWLVPVLGVATVLALLPSALAERSPGEPGGRRTGGCGARGTARPAGRRGRLRPRGAQG
ncbi:hypothetical protein G3I76_11910, partial [Streptomyces sp. SID11233]|nr:hypothetical protein [Streptomyces sp. SID11233]